MYLETFITLIVPLFILTLFVVFGILMIVGDLYQKSKWNGVDKVEDEMDALLYEKKRFKKFADHRIVVTLFMERQFGFATQRRQNEGRRSSFCETRFLV